MTLTQLIDRVKEMCREQNMDPNAHFAVLIMFKIEVDPEVARIPGPFHNVRLDAKKERIYIS